MHYSLPQSRIYCREEYVTGLCVGKKVVHVGAAQANDQGDLSIYDSAIDPRNFLHTRISRVASRCIGIDYNRSSIDYLRSRFGVSNICYGDIEDSQSLKCIDFVPDVVVMGEILEHLPNPGFALTNISKNLMHDDTVLIVTVPNALDAANFVYGLLRREAHDPDHVAYYTPRLFARLCEKSGLAVESINYYQATMTCGDRSYYRLNGWAPRKVLLYCYYNSLLRLNSGFASGLIFTVRNAGYIRAPEATTGSGVPSVETE